jgi:hypothetical protein
MAMDVVAQRLEIGDVVLVDLGEQAGEVEAKVFRSIERTETTVRVSLRVQGREDFVREWPVGEMVTIVPVLERLSHFTCNRCRMDTHQHLARIGEGVSISSTCKPSWCSRTVNTLFPAAPVGLRASGDLAIHHVRSETSAPACRMSPDGAVSRFAERTLRSGGD